jgi:hypothetical protein
MVEVDKLALQLAACVTGGSRRALRRALHCACVVSRQARRVLEEILDCGPQARLAWRVLIAEKVEEGGLDGLDLRTGERRAAQAQAGQRLGVGSRQRCLQL